MPLTPSRALPAFPYAMYFNGSSSTYINFTPNLINNLAYQGQFTLMVWLSALGGGVIVGYSDALPGSSQSGWVPLIYVVYPNSVVVGEWTGYESILSYSYNGNGFIHVTEIVSYNSGTNTTSIYQYINGSYINSVNASGPPWNNNSYSSWSGKTIYNTIGNGFACGWPGGLGCPAPFYGYIAQVLLYSRVLSSSEIQWNYNNPKNPITNGLVLWYYADPNNVVNVGGNLQWVDLSGNGNNGTLYGAQLVQLIGSPSRILSPTRILTPIR
jgi:hypothetical protein